MWTEMINAAGQIRGSVSPNRICVNTVVRALRRGERRGEVDNGWLLSIDSVAGVRDALDVFATWITWS
jgi:hypothetical protein